MDNLPFGNGGSVVRAGRAECNDPGAAHAGILKQLVVHGLQGVHDGGKGVGGFGHHEADAVNVGQAAFVDDVHELRRKADFGFNGFQLVQKLGERLADAKVGKLGHKVLL